MCSQMLCGVSDAVLIISEAEIVIMLFWGILLFGVMRLRLILGPHSVEPYRVRLFLPTVNTYTANGGFIETGSGTPETARLPVSVPSPERVKVSVVINIHVSAFAR